MWVIVPIACHIGTHELPANSHSTAWHTKSSVASRQRQQRGWSKWLWPGKAKLRGLPGLVFFFVFYFFLPLSATLPYFTTAECGIILRGRQTRKTLAMQWPWLQRATGILYFGYTHGTSFWPIFLLLALSSFLSSACYNSDPNLKSWTRDLVSATVRGDMNASYLAKPISSIATKVDGHSVAASSLMVKARWPFWPIHIVRKTPILPAWLSLVNSSSHIQYRVGSDDAMQWGHRQFFFFHCGYHW